MASSETQPRSDSLDAWAAKGNSPAYTLLVTGAVLALFAAVFSYVAAVHAQLGWWLACGWAVSGALVSLGCGAWLALHEPTRDLNKADATRLAFLTVGALIGLATTILGVCLAATWWNEAFAGSLDTWRKNWKGIFLSVGTILGGLALAFASLQLARSKVRTSPVLRRLLYGSNAVLTGILLLLVLVVLNVMTYVKPDSSSVLARPLAWYGEVFSRPTDWTAANIYSLAPATQNLLRGLDKPLKIYLLLTRDGEDMFMREELNRLLATCRNYTNQIDIELINPDFSDEKLAELAKKHTLLDRRGVLLVYGEEPAKSDFIKVEDLSQQDFRNRTYTFKGESALYDKLKTLTSDAAKPIIYFTQGSGEPDIKKFDATGNVQGLGELKSKLERGGLYEVKELELGPAKTTIPDDANIIIVVNPTLGLHPDAQKALSEWMRGSGKKKGKLIALLDPNIDDGKMKPTGLEGLLAEWGVELPPERVLTANIFSTGSPTTVTVVANPDSRNPVAEAFRGIQAYFPDVRPVRPQTASRPDANRKTEALLLAVSAVWAEPDLKVSPSTYVRELLKADRREELLKKLSKEVPVAVTVAETSGATPPDPHLSGSQNKQETPRMVVFGMSRWLGNRTMRDRVGDQLFSLFDSNVRWLAGRADVGETPVTDVQRKQFRLDGKDTPVVRMQWLPGVLLLLGIIGLGGGIWVVRRR